MNVTLYDARGDILDPTPQPEKRDWRDTALDMMIAESDRILAESLPELEQPLEAEGWRRLTTEAQYEFSPRGRWLLYQIARLMYLKNPLIRRGVEVKVIYVWGLGWSIKCDEDIVNDVIQEFMDDARNAVELTSQQARESKERTQQIKGNTFFVFFPNKSTGLVRVRTILAEEIVDIICDPEDAKTPWFYKRVWSEQPFDVASGNVSPKERTAYYPDWRYQDDIPDAIGNQPVMKDTPVYHVKTGGTDDMKFGLPEFYPAIDWARAAKEQLEDWATVRRALSQFAMKLNTTRGPRGVAAAKARMGTTIGPSTFETNPPSLPGSTFISTEGTDIKAFESRGAQPNPDEGRRLWLMACMVFGVPECYSSDTEVLTEQGFIRHDEWRPGNRVACFNPDSGQIEWHEPKGLTSSYYNGAMVHFKNGQTDILVTPNHRMWTAPRMQWDLLPAEEVATGAPRRPGRTRVADGGQPQVDRSWRIETAEHLVDDARLDGWKVTSALRWAEPEQPEEIDTPIGQVNAVAWARFIGYWLSEGHASASRCKSGEYLKDGSPRMRTFRRIGLSQNPGPTLDAMKDTCAALGLHARETRTGRADVRALVIYHKPLWEWLREHCGTNSATKRIPRELLYGGAAVRHALYSALMDGDGGRTGGSWRYSTISAELANQMQILANSLGYGSSLSLEKRTEGSGLYKGHSAGAIYRVYIRTNLTTTSILKPKHMATVPYSGMVHCFSVPHGIYVTRRNGRIAIQGNTFFGDADLGNHATAKTLDRPTELLMRGRQTFWIEVFQQIFSYVIDWSIRAPNGLLSGSQILDRNGDPKWVLEDDPTTGEPLSRHVDIHFQDILEQEATARVQAIVQAATLGNAQGVPAGTIAPKDVSMMLLAALGVDDLDEVMARMFPEPDEGDALPGDTAQAVAEVREAFAELVKVVGETLEKSAA